MFDKITRVLVIVLLTAILGVQVYSITNTPAPSEECLTAIDDAVALTTLMDGDLSATLEDYQTAAYETAENINQQIFMANEYSLINLTLMAEYNEAMLNIQTYCR